MLGRVLEHMPVAADLGEVEVIEQLAATKQVDDIAQAVEVRRGAQQHAPRPQQHPQAPECDVTGDRQMLDHLGEEDRVEAPVRGRILQRQIPLESVDPARPQLGEAALLDVGDAPASRPRALPRGTRADHPRCRGRPAPGRAPAPRTAAGSPRTGCGSAGSSSGPPASGPPVTICSNARSKLVAVSWRTLSSRARRWSERPTALSAARPARYPIAPRSSPRRRPAAASRQSPGRLRRPSAQGPSGCGRASSPRG